MQVFAELYAQVEADGWPETLSRYGFDPIEVADLADAAERRDWDRRTMACACLIMGALHEQGVQATAESAAEALLLAMPGSEAPMEVRAVPGVISEIEAIMSQMSANDVGAYGRGYHRALEELRTQIRLRFGGEHG